MKPEPRYVSETAALKQTKLVMVFKTDCTDEFACKLAEKIYGGTPFSRLFMNVREKLSLCYYCSTHMTSRKGSMSVDCGVAPENLQMAQEEILHQLELLQQGDISDEEIEDAKRYYFGTLRSISDYSENQNSWFFTRFSKGDLLTPQQAEELAAAVTKERIVAAARSFKLDTVFALEPNGAEGGEDDE